MGNRAYSEPTAEKAWELANKIVQMESNTVGHRELRAIVGKEIFTLEDVFAIPLAEVWNRIREVL